MRIILEKAKMKLRREVDVNYIKELREIHSKMVKKDNNCLKLSLYEVESLWEMFSKEYYADFVNVKDENIVEFLEWL